MSSDDPLLVELVDWARHKETLRSIRGTVFIEEQGVPQKIEWDDQDEQASHFLASLAGEVVGCARRLDNGKVGRLAVLPSHRGKGYGRAILGEIIALAKSQGLARLYLHAQVHASDFYLAAGFHPTGTPFSEANIAHIEMAMTLNYMGFSGFISGVHYPQPFDALATALCASATRHIRILSPTLDHAVFDQPALCDAVSALAGAAANPRSEY